MEGRAVAEVGVVVFARLPVEGKVKTRLAATVGKQAACSFYRTCAERTLREMSACRGAETVVFYSDAAEADGVAQWLGSLGLPLATHPQVSQPNLGDRMQAALAALLARGHRKAIVVGTDIPGLCAGHVEAAARALDAHGAVLGPALDGGYYLLGLNGSAPKSLFEGVSWSASTTRAEQRARAEELGIPTAPDDTLPPLRDVDTEADLREWIGTADPSHPVYRVAMEALERGGGGGLGFRT